MLLDVIVVVLYYFEVIGGAVLGHLEVTAEHKSWLVGANGSTFMGGINKSPTCAGFDVEENNREIIFTIVKRICGGMFSLGTLLLIQQLSILLSHVFRGGLFRVILFVILSFLKNNLYFSNQWSSLILPLQ